MIENHENMDIFSTRFIWIGAKTIIMLPNNLTSYHAHYGVQTAIQWNSGIVK